MLNLLHDISVSAFRTQKLRAEIQELTELLHREELKIAVYAQQCITVRTEELNPSERINHVHNPGTNP